MKKYDLLILQYHLFILGGIESYYYRIMRWAYRNKIRVILIIDKNSKFDSSWREKLDELNVEIFYVSGCYPFYSFKSPNGQKLELSASESILNISASYECYSRAEYLRKQFSVVNFKNIIYVFHPYTVKISKYTLLERYLRKKMLPVIISSGSMVFMDEETRASGKKYYPDLIDDEQKVVRLGYEVGEEVKEEQLIKKYNNTEKNIYAICRFEFPFKSYVLGLVEVFAQLSCIYSDLNLIIIGKGEDKNVLENKIATVDKGVSKKIKIIDGVSYERINEHIDKAFLNVGMGTTILDFANRSVPSIIGIAYDISDVSYGIWSRNCDIVGGTIEEKLAPVSSIKDNIDDILNMNIDEYINTCKMHRKLLVENYSIDTVMNSLFDLSVSAENSVSKYALHICSINHVLKKKEKRIKEWIKRMLFKK